MTTKRELENNGGVTEAARLSRMLWESREAAEMYADVVRARMGSDPAHLRGLVARIDAYRAERGWDPDGFGGEDSTAGGGLDQARSWTR